MNNEIEETYKMIKEKIIAHEIYQNVKDYYKEKEKVSTYYEIGKIVFDTESIYGNKTITELSNKLSVEFGNNYSYRNLLSYKKFYDRFSDKKLYALRSKLSWTHYRELIKLKNTNEIIYYIEISLIHNLSYRKLSEKIKNKEYSRLDYSTKMKLIKKTELVTTDFVKNPILIKNNSNYEIISEKILQKLILEDIENFMKELGSSFCFIGSEYKIKLGDKYNYIDLLLYNIKFKCYVVIELKITELKKEHIGQIQTYMNYIDKNLRTIEEDKTIGIIIVKKNDKYIMEYCSDDRIIAKEYEIVY